MNPKELALSIARFLDSKKATDLEVIQIGELTTIGDYFVVASAGNTTLVKSLCEDLDEYLGQSYAPINHTMENAKSPRSFSILHFQFSITPPLRKSRHSG